MNWKIVKSYGKEKTKLNLEDWILKIQELGAGEILIQCG